MHSPFEPEVMVSYQGDHYMGVNGVKYLITPLVEDMDQSGRIFQQTRAQSKPTLGNPNSSKGPKQPSQSDIPTALPMSTSPGTIPEVSSKRVNDALYHMLITRIYVDNPYVVFISKPGRTSL